MDVADTLRLALADRYAIERELGQGGMATVYLARDLRHDRSVAIKVLRPELSAALGSERFLREIKTTAQLTHPHILPLLDSGAANGTLFYVMPFVEGESLRDRLTREKQLPLDEALQIAREVADALGYAHSLGLVHRDIKPENILFEAGHAVVADFGIAKALAAAGSASLTETGLAIGTPAYMSPEQAAGSHDVDGRSDLYSLGCVLYEMLSGETPYTGPTPQAILAKKLSEPLPRISVVREAVPPGIETALGKALARTPADRYVTAAQFAEALTSSAALRPMEPGRATPRARRVAVLLAGLLVVVVAAGVLLKVGLLRLSPGAGGGSRVTSLVVLPLKNLSGDTTQEYFADGMTDALITELDKVAALSVISVTSAMSYKGSRKPLPEIARELGVQGVVEGSVGREGGRIRIGARLIDARTDRPVWDSTYDRQASGVLAVQAEVARTIAGAIGATLTPEEARRLQVTRTVNPQAYDEYLLGRHDALLQTAEGCARAIAHFRRAIALDSTFADPRAGLVYVYNTMMSVYGMSPKEGGVLEQAEAERAVALDSASALAHAALASVRFAWQWRWAEADAEFRRALQLNPGSSDVHYWYSMFLTALGRHDEAVAHALRAVVLDPLQAAIRLNIGFVYFYAGRYQEAIAAYEKALELDPSSAMTNVFLGYAYSALGRHLEAIAAVGRALREDPGSQVVLSSAAWIYARAGRPAVARGFIDSLTALGKKEWVDPYWFGQAYAWLGETDLALAYFSKAIDERSVGNVWGLKIEYLPEAFKADPRFHALLRRLGLE